MSMIRALLIILTSAWTATGTKSPPPEVASMDRQEEVVDRDNTGTNGAAEKTGVSQTPVKQVVANRPSFKAEGRGLEPPTGFPAPDFESGC